MVPRKELTELNEEPAVAFPLVRRHCKDTGYIVVITGLLLFGEVADNVESSLVQCCHYVEQEWVCVVTQCFVVQEQFGQQTQVLCVNFVFTSVYFKE